MHAAKKDGSCHLEASSKGWRWMEDSNCRGTYPSWIEEEEEEEEDKNACWK
jgi:hypothetical protein